MQKLWFSKLKKKKKKKKKKEEEENIEQSKHKGLVLLSFL